MRPEQAAAFVMAQAVCAMAEVLGMEAENQQRLAQGELTPFYKKEDFLKIQDNYCIGHNSVMELFNSTNKQENNHAEI
jgi:hypothetical protein